MPIELRGDVTVAPPTLPAIRTAPPASTTALVYPVIGPEGPRGPAGDETGLGFVHHQSSPVTTVQINHGFLFRPAGITCIATGDTFPLLGVGITYPTTGIIELSFGSPFTGDVYLS